MAKRKAAKRELINTGTDKRYVRRNSQGQFKESDDVGRSTAQDRRRKATKKAKRGQGIAAIADRACPAYRLPLPHGREAPAPKRRATLSTLPRVAPCREEVRGRHRVHAADAHVGVPRRQLLRWPDRQHEQVSNTRAADGRHEPAHLIEVTGAFTGTLASRYG